MNYEKIIKKALYHCDYNNVHRKTRKEAEEGTFLCPRCKGNMNPKRNKGNHIHMCEDCHFFLRDDQLRDKAVPQELEKVALDKTSAIKFDELPKSIQKSLQGFLGLSTRLISEVLDLGSKYVIRIKGFDSKKVLGNSVLKALTSNSKFNHIQFESPKLLRINFDK